MEMMVTHKTSITQKIQHSPWFSERFNEHVQSMTENPASSTAARIRNLSAAKHRFHSLQDPVSRAILFMESLLMVAMEASIVRKGRAEGTAADQWLDWVDEELLLTLGMLGDAGDEAGQFINFWDTSDYDTASIGIECHKFVHNIDCLFVKGHCMKHGFAKYTPRLLQLGSAKVKRVASPGGLPADLVEMCLARLRCWVKLAVSVVQAEFPSWEILQAFSVFGLSRKKNTAVSQLGTVQTENLRRLDTLCGVDHNALRAQFLDVLPMATHVHQSGDVDNVEAWRVALRRLQVAHSNVQGSHPIDAMLPVFARYAAWAGCSTSGQERVHAKQDWLFTTRRRCMSAALERDEIKLGADVKPEEVVAVLNRAQQLWSAHYGLIRRVTQRRLDCGVPKARDPSTKHIHVQCGPNVGQSTRRGCLPGSRRSGKTMGIP